MHLRDFLWFLICVALLLATFEGARDPHLPEWLYCEFAEWLDNSALMTGTEYTPFDGTEALSDDRPYMA